MDFWELLYAVFNGLWIGVVVSRFLGNAHSGSFPWSNFFKAIAVVAVLVAVELYALRYLFDDKTLRNQVGAVVGLVVFVGALFLMPKVASTGKSE